MSAPRSRLLRQRWVFWLCAIATGLICYACTPVSTQDPATGNQPIELNLWQGINPPPNRDVFDRLVDRFNANHLDIQVNSIYAGQSEQQMPKVLTAVVGDVPPDILWFSPTATGKFIDLDAIVPLDDWFADSTTAQNLDPALREAMVMDDRICSVPMATNNVGIFYRPSLFEEAGIEKLPTTWAEFAEVSQQLSTDADRHGMLLPLGKGEWTVFTWLPFLYSAGGDPIRDGLPTLATPEAQSALELWATAIDNDSAILSQPERGFELDDFLAGRVAMQLTGPWTLEQLNASGVDYGVMPIPQQKEAATIVGGEHLFVMKTDPAREAAALEFLEYALSEEFQTEWAIGTGYLPVNLKSRESQEYREYVASRPVLDVFLNQMVVARSRPIVSGYTRLSDALGRAIEQALLGESPEVALAQAQERIDRFWGS
ncbi:MAG: ABC transporter substrate-binding protein [Geitlerinemataceae cyanobacterium]